MNANTKVDSLPEGYRYANGTEVNRRQHPYYFVRMVQVKGTCTNLFTGGYYSYAIKDD